MRADIVEISTYQFMKNIYHTKGFLFYLECDEYSLKEFKQGRYTIRTEF